MDDMNNPTPQALGISGRIAALFQSAQITPLLALVAFLLGVSAITVPWDTLLTSVVLYIVIPVIIAQLMRRALLRQAQQIRCGVFIFRRHQAVHHRALTRRALKCRIERHKNLLQQSLAARIRFNMFGQHRLVIGIP